MAHLDDEESTLILGVLLQELITSVRSLPGSRGLRALTVFDEGVRLLAPSPQKPATKGLATGDRKADQLLDNTVQQFAKRWFVMGDMHAGPAPAPLQPRHAMKRIRAGQ